MAELNPLLQLRDIHLPAEAHNWPPAPGWIILLIIITLICIKLGIYITRLYPIWRTNKHALRLLKHYQKQFKEEHNSQKTCALINELLKKTAFFYYPRSLVASLKGQAWIDFLNKTMPLSKRSYNFNTVSKELLKYPYQNSQDLNLDELFILTSIWIKSRSNSKHKEELCLK